jgi:hypothetical protein
MKPKPAHLLRRADAFCARLNDGLAAVAVVLLLITCAAMIERFPTPATTGNFHLGDLISDYLHHTPSSDSHLLWRGLGTSK